MKKAVFLVMLMALMLWGCSGEDETSDKTDTAGDQSIQAQSAGGNDKELHKGEINDREKQKSISVSPNEQSEAEEELQGEEKTNLQEELQDQPEIIEEDKLKGSTGEGTSDKKGEMAYLEKDAAKKAAIAEQAKEKLVSAKRDAYYERLKNLENQYDAKKLYASGGSTSEISSKLWAYYEIWDKELNDIYGQLTSSLSGEALEKMRQQEREWIVERDRRVNEACNENSGGKTVMIIQPDRLIQETKTRIYELAEIYYAK